MKPATHSSVTAVRPRPVICVIDHLHRDRRVADDACDGRFTLAGITRDLGPEPDWLGADLPSDEEWRIEWTKFYFGLDLAHALAETGDERYAAAWERLVGSYIRTVPIGVDSSDVAARRVQNWVYAWVAFADAGFDDLFVAFPVVGADKALRLLGLADRARLAVGVDSVEGARTLAAPFHAASRTLDVMLKVDVGLHRVGVEPLLSNVR